VDPAGVALPFTQTDLHQVVFAEADLVAVLPQGHRLAGRRAVAMKDFANQRFIALRPTTLLRSQIDMAMRRAGPALQGHVEDTSGATARPPRAPRPANSGGGGAGGRLPPGCGRGHSAERA